MLHNLKVSCFLYIYLRAFPLCAGGYARQKYQRSLFNWCSNSQQSQPSQHQHKEVTEICRPKKTANQDMASEPGPYSTTSITHSGYYPKQTARQSQTAQSSHCTCSVRPYAESSDIQYMLYRSERFTSTVNQKRLVSGPWYLKTSETAVNSEYRKQVSPFLALQWIRRAWSLGLILF
jgi:hypothetical protein